MDAVSKIAVREFIQKINRERGTTVILTTHDMQDIEALTERIILIGKGRILKDGTLEDLTSECSELKNIRKMKLEYKDGAIPCIQGVVCENLENGHAVLKINTSEISVSRAIERISANVSITDLSVEGTNIDELVAALYREYRI